MYIWHSYMKDMPFSVLTVYSSCENAIYVLTLPSRSSTLWPSTQCDQQHLVLLNLPLYNIWWNTNDNDHTWASFVFKTVFPVTYLQMGSEVDCSGVSRAVWLVKVFFRFLRGCLNLDFLNLLAVLRVPLMINRKLHEFDSLYKVSYFS